MRFGDEAGLAASGSISATTEYCDGAELLAVLISTDSCAEIGVGGTLRCFSRRC